MTDPNNPVDDDEADATRSGVLERDTAVNGTPPDEAAEQADDQRDGR